MVYLKYGLLNYRLDPPERDPPELDPPEERVPDDLFVCFVGLIFLGDVCL